MKNFFKLLSYKIEKEKSERKMSRKCKKLFHAKETKERDHAWSSIANDYNAFVCHTFENSQLNVFVRYWIS